MPDASSPLNEDNVAEALQGIKDARQSTERAWLLAFYHSADIRVIVPEPQKKADIVQVFALRLDAGPEVSL